MFYFSTFGDPFIFLQRQMGTANPDHGITEVSKAPKRVCPSGPRGHVQVVMCSHSWVRIPQHATILFFSFLIFVDQSSTRRKGSARREKKPLTSYSRKNTMPKSPQPPHWPNSGSTFCFLRQRPKKPFLTVVTYFLLAKKHVHVYSSTW